MSHLSGTAGKNRSRAQFRAPAIPGFVSPQVALDEFAFKTINWVQVPFGTDRAPGQWHPITWLFHRWGATDLLRRSVFFHFHVPRSIANLYQMDWTERTNQVRR